MNNDWIKIKKQTFMGGQGEAINDEVFKEYVAKYGHEKATAYLQAVNDFTRQLEVILDGGFVRPGRTTTGHALQKKIENLVFHNTDFLKKIHSSEKVSGHTSDGPSFS